MLTYPLQIGDYVLAKFETSDKVDCFIPGVISVTPKKSKVKFLVCCIC